MKIPKTMKAATAPEQGKVEFFEKKVPRLELDEVLLKVEACAICGTDIEVINRGLDKQPPYGSGHVLGHEYAGTVVKRGETVDEVKIGDRVAVEVHHGCGRCKNCLEGKHNSCLNYGNPEKGHRANGLTTDGGFAEYVSNKVDTVYKIPDNLSFDQATMVTTAACPLYAIETAGGYIVGDDIVVLGCGPIGLMQVQTAKALGANSVILTGTRERRLEIGKQVGADIVVNVREGESSLEATMDLTNNIGADKVFVAVGAPSTLESVSSTLDEAIKICRPGGCIVQLAFYGGSIEADMDMAVQKDMEINTVRGEGGNIARSLSLMASGKITANPLITHTFPFDELHKAFKTFVERIDGAMKVVVHPNE